LLLRIETGLLSLKSSKQINLDGCSVIDRLGSGFKTYPEEVVKAEMMLRPMEKPIAWFLVM